MARRCRTLAHPPRYPRSADPDRPRPRQTGSRRCSTPPVPGVAALVPDRSAPPAPPPGHRSAGQWRRSGRRRTPTASSTLSAREILATDLAPDRRATRRRRQGPGLPAANRPPRPRRFPVAATHRAPRCSRRRTAPAPICENRTPPSPHARFPPATAAASVPAPRSHQMRHPHGTTCFRTPRNRRSLPDRPPRRYRPSRRCRPRGTAAAPTPDPAPRAAPAGPAASARRHRSRSCAVHCARARPFPWRAANIHAPRPKCRPPAEHLPGHRVAPTAREKRCVPPVPRSDWRLRSPLPAHPTHRRETPASRPPSV